MTAGRPLSAGRATRVLARLTARRALRSAPLWIAVGIGVLPALLAGALAAGMDDATGDKVLEGVLQLGLIPLLGVIPPLLLGDALAEELENKTYTYLWARPIPRWTVLSGKMALLVPAAIVLMMGSAAAVYGAASSAGTPDGAALGPTLVGLAAGAVAASAASVGVGALSKRFSLGLAIIYMLLVDLPLGALPFSLASLSITHHVRELSPLTSASGAAGWTGLVWMLGIGAVWLAVAALRARRVE